MALFAMKLELFLKNIALKDSSKKKRERLRGEKRCF